MVVEAHTGRHGPAVNPIGTDAVASLADKLLEFGLRRRPTSSTGLAHAPDNDVAHPVPDCCGTHLEVLAGCAFSVAAAPKCAAAHQGRWQGTATIGEWSTGSAIA